MRLLIISVLLLFSANTFAQNSNVDKQRKVIQFSGTIVSGDSLHPVPFVNVAVKGSRRGTYSDVFGFFSFAALERDTIIFSSVGFHSGQFVLPDTLSDSRYFLIHVMYLDTVSLPEAVIRAFPTREQFKDAFLNFQIKDDDLEKARMNLQAIDYYRNVKELEVDSRSAYNSFSSQRNTQIYNKGLAPYSNIANPMAWFQFIQSWKKGELEVQKKKESNSYLRDK